MMAKILLALIYMKFVIIDLTVIVFEENNCLVIV